MGDDIKIKTPNKRFEEIKNIDENGIEYWEARELMPVLEYDKWENFEKVVVKAIEACINSGQDVIGHFPEIKKMVKLGSGSERQVKDYKLSRYACYLIAQNGDSTKRAVALAQTYFAIQTRRQEISQELEEGEKRMFIRDEVKVHNKKLFATARAAGVDNFGRFNNAGYEGLYGMRKSQIQKKKRIGKDDILDRAGATELAANLFRITQTDEKIRNENIRGDYKASNTHFEVGKKVRATIREIGGIMPENLPPQPHIKELSRKQKSLKMDSIKRLK